MIPPADPAPDPPAPTPIPNSYWVRPGRLLAGEYPGSSSRATAIDRIQRLLRAGVNTFIDLTCEGELAAYEALLPADAAIPVRYERWPITDHGLPESTQFMAQILDAIDAALAEERCVYVHCRAGIGRTGTTIGCHLIRGGLEPDAAMDHLQTLWQQCERSTSWTMTPETDEQYNFVLRWHEAGGRGQRHVPSIAERNEGALLGLACGDALGNLLATGRHELRQLTQETLAPGIVFDCGANTLMAWAVAGSLLERGGHDAEDQMQRYLHESRAASAAFPAEVRRALASWQWSRKPNAGSHDPRNLDPHSLARSLAAALYRRTDPAAAIDLAADVSRTTQQSPVVLDLCRLWTALFIDALSGEQTARIISLRDGAALQVLRARRLRGELDGLLNHRGDLTLEGGDALSVTARALQAFKSGVTIADGMRLSLEGASPAAAGAQYGALAGAHLGVSAIPSSWLRALPQRQALRDLAQRFAP